MDAESLAAENAMMKETNGPTGDPYFDRLCAQADQLRDIAEKAFEELGRARAENARLLRALRDIEMETRHGSQWTRYEINEVARAALGESA